MVSIEKLLEESRRELLDLSTRNRLLSMPVESKSARVIHLRDEKSDHVFRLLVGEGKTFAFLPGIDKKIPTSGVDGADTTSLDFGEEANGLPQPEEDVEDVTGEAPRHIDTKLQTALTSDGLQRRLLSLYRDAQLIIEEQGVNILYLALGRLKWFEADKADTPRFAPLILVPVELHRRSARERFTFTWREEDVQENLSLAAKLKTEFGVDLPKFPDEEDLVPSQYGAAVAKTVAGQRRWEVQPDGITLGFFSFAKFLMYRDLDPCNWPDSQKLLTPTLCGLLRDGFPASDSPFSEDTKLDEVIPASRLDHVVDADSSQTVAIETVRAGQSVVIQGPPGTGKSQSITNLIATAVLDGKKVLFVAEKLAALEVVKRRLEASGLGDLCLELHSHKANKRTVLEEIGRSWQLGRPRGEELEQVVPRLDQARSNLNGHVAMLHTPLCATGATPFLVIGELALLGERGREMGELDLPEAVGWDTEAVVVEKVSPALEVDGLEAGMLADEQSGRQFRILVTTPEKLDLMLRAGWEEKIGRPLTLVVVDEAHGLASPQRGLKIELLLATINRECRYAQFLLLTPFIHNAAEVARWLSPDSNKNIELSIEWTPNDRVIAIARPHKGTTRGDFDVRLFTKHTTRDTINVPEALDVGQRRPLGLSWSAVSNSSPKLAAATAQVLQRRGTVIILVDTPKSSWDLAKTFKVEENRVTAEGSDLIHIKRFLSDEMGPNYPLTELLEYGVAVHHSGLSEDTRTLVEWLTEQTKLTTLIATTTIAQGVNFPVSGVIFASHQYRLSKFPFREDMPPEDFWNIAGRAGRVDQGDLGIVALSAHNETKERQLEEFIERSVGALNSTLIDIVRKAADEGKLLQLESLAWQPGWSAFLQYLAHTYRQIGNHERFAAEVEQVLRGTLGFQTLRRSHRGWADDLVRGVYNYAERIKGKPLKLVDATGFSWESVSNTLVRLNQENLTREVWSPELFGANRADLQRMMGILLQVPELRDPLKEVTGGSQPNGDMLSRIICDWVQGRSLTEMATEYFANTLGGEESPADVDPPVAAMTRCCRSVFGRLTQTASWGLAALQSLTLGDTFDTLSNDEQRFLRNLPARVYYGVNSDEAVGLRLLGVPRTAATPLATVLRIGAGEPLSEVRVKLRGAHAREWIAALGERGESYHRVWSIIDGDA